MSKVEQIPEKEKKFLPGQVGTHNKCIDILVVLAACSKKINGFKKQIENVDADMDLVPDFACDTLINTRNEIIELHDRQVNIYRRLCSYYLNTLSKCYQPAIYHDMDFYPKPDARKNVKAA